MTCAVGTLGCGGSAGAVPGDAGDLPDSGDDPCGCARAVALSPDTVYHTTFEGPEGPIVPGGFVNGHSISCAEGWRDTVIGGSCAALPGMYDRVYRIMSGYFRHRDEGSTIDRGSWLCIQYNPATNDTAVVASTAVCHRPPDAPPPPPDGCTCPPVEPLEDRLSFPENSTPIVIGQPLTVEASCDEGQVLIGGSCALDIYDDFQLRLLDEGLHLSSAGMVAGAARPTWRCNWSPYPGPDETANHVYATAVCMRPSAPNTAPEPVPLHERIEYVSATSTIEGNVIDLTVNAACSPGNYLYSGSCMVNSDDPATFDISLNALGYTPGPDDPIGWRCTWTNQTGMPAEVTTTAICVRAIDE